MAVHPLRPATDRRLGGPLPRQLANRTRAHPVPPEFFTLPHAGMCAYAVLAAVSSWYPPVRGRLPTRYSPVRHSVIHTSSRGIPCKCFVRLACVKHAASVHPEPGSNSHFLVCPASHLASSFCFLDYCFWLSFLFSCLKFRLPSGSPALRLPLPGSPGFWNFQGCITVYLSRFRFSGLSLSSAATLIGYHMSSALSTTFFIFFFVVFYSPKQGFILPYSPWLVNIFLICLVSNSN